MLLIERQRISLKNLCPQFSFWRKAASQLWF